MVQRERYTVNGIPPQEGRLDTPNTAATLWRMAAKHELEELGSRLKKAFADKGLNTVDEIRDAFAEVNGGKKVSPTTVSRWFNGHSPPDKYMTKLVQFLGTEWIGGYKKSESAPPPTAAEIAKAEATLERARRAGLVPESRVSGVRGVEVDLEPRRRRSR